ncbi:hypothetical protein HDV00_000530 [Rhizophlyctis rosea]|nr:hypothetical protein HDV00_000530 [Rhizophlyctis rosea]
MVSTYRGNAVSDQVLTYAFQTPKITPTMAATTKSFSKLLEQSKQLTNHVIPPGLPQLERSIEQIDSQSKRLLKRTQRAGEGTATPDTRTAYLLANRGHDPERTINALNQINLTGAFEPLVGVRDTDIDGYLENEHQTIVSLAVEEGKLQTIHAYEDAFERALYKDWEKAKRRIFEELGQHQGGRIIAGGSTPSASAGGFGSIPGLLAPNGGPIRETSARGRITMNSKFAQYLPVVRQLNESRRLNIAYDVIGQFSIAATGLSKKDGSQEKHLQTCWDLIYRMLGSDSRRLGEIGGSALRERQFFNAYHNPKSDEGLRLREHMVQGGRSWLEDTFAEFVTKRVEDQKGQIGGRPTIHDFVREYLRITYNKGDNWTLDGLEFTEDNQPFWAHVYVLVRCGKRDEANEYIKRYSAFLDRKGSRFAYYFDQWKHNGQRLPRSAREELSAEWNSSIRNYTLDPSSPTGDIFKYALYKLIGRCEMSVKTIRSGDIIATAEDFLWVHLMLVQESGYEGEPMQDKFSLRDLGMRMWSYRAENFPDPISWFSVLLASGEFERAIGELSKHANYDADAVHFAIALAYLGILRVPEDATITSDEVVTGSEADQYQLESGRMYQPSVFNFIQVPQYLARLYGKGDPIDTLHYVFLLGLFISRGGSQPNATTSTSYAQAAQHLIRDVISESKRFEELLGNVAPDGTYTVGLVEKYGSLVGLADRDSFVDLIVVQAARNADQRGDLRSSAQLYHIGEQYGKVVEIVNRQLADRLAQHQYGVLAAADGGVEGGRETWVEMAEGILAFYEGAPRIRQQVSGEGLVACRLLIAFTRFMECMREEGGYVHALQIIYQTDLIPASGSQADILRRVNAFRAVDPNVARNVPEVLVKSMEALRWDWERVTGGQRFGGGGGAGGAVGGGDAVAEGRGREVKEKADALMRFAGALGHRIPGETLVQMNRINVQMG